MKDFFLVKYFIRGGIMMWPILALSVLAIAISIERAIVYFKIKIDVVDFMSMIKQLLIEKNLDGAIEFCEAHKGPIAAITRAGLIRYKQLKSLSSFKTRSRNKRDIIEKTVEAAANEEVGYLERGFIWLGTVINLAPLLGFLGTVTGMIKAFDAMAKAGLGDPSVVAGGISEALITTASGLIVAGPTVLLYNLFASIVEHYIVQMQEVGEDLLDTIENIEEGIKMEVEVS